MAGLMRLNYGGHRRVTHRGIILTAFPDGDAGNGGEPIRSQIQWALAKAVHIAGAMPSANKYFMTLAKRRSLSSILSDSSIWLNYAVWTEDRYGVRDGNSDDIGIFPKSFRFGRWTVLATLIHECAHVAGAPGDSSHAAEKALLYCGLGRWSEYTSQKDDSQTPYQPDFKH